MQEIIAAKLSIIYDMAIQLPNYFLFIHKKAPIHTQLASRLCIIGLSSPNVIEQE